MVKHEKAGYGYLGKSDYYDEGTQKPEYYGKVTIDNREFELAGWARQKEGRSYISLQVSHRVEEVVSDVENKKEAIPVDDVPF